MTEKRQEKKRTTINGRMSIEVEEVRECKFSTSVIIIYSNFK